MAHDWTPPGYFRLFVSHVSERHEFASDVSGFLESWGISGFIAHTSISPTKRWQRTIESALDTMDALLALFHPGLYKSKWCDQEIGFALGRKKLVIPVRLGADPHGFISSLQAITPTDSNNKLLAKKIAGVLAKHKRTAKRLARGLSHALRISRSYDESCAKVALLEQIPTASEATRKVMLSAIEANSQVSDADHNNLPNRIRNVSKAWERANHT